MRLDIARIYALLLFAPAAMSTTYARTTTTTTTTKTKTITHANRIIETSDNGTRQREAHESESHSRQGVRMQWVDEELDNESVTLNDVKKRDVDEAVEIGLRMMRDLYYVKEPLLYSMGLFLDETEAAGRVASFSQPSARALQQARFGYAAIQASLRIREKYPESRSRRNPEHISFLRTDAFDDECPLRGIPRCSPASRRYRTSDGTCNNPKFPWKGASMLPMQRFLLPEYEDDVQAVRRAVRNGARLPSAREVSIRIHRDRDVEMTSVTMMFVQWGQFIDHDITSTAQSRAFNSSIPRCCARGGGGFLPPEFTHPECMPIEVPEDDWFLGRMGMRCIEFIRSAPSSRINCDLGWREQINQVTSYIDGSTVYGSDSERADTLRIFRNGLMQYGRSRRSSQVPPDPPGGELCRLGAVSMDCFKGGDTRAGEQPGLTAFHTVWLRYHNRLAAILGNINPHWSDEKIYQETRRIVGALMQHLTYKEFLPIVLGHEVMDLFDLDVERKGYYNGYDPRVNPAPANAFSTAAFRFGHSLVQHSFLRSDSKHRLLVNNVSIHEELDNPENIWTFGSLDRLVLGFCNQPSQRRDEFISRELTHHLFQQPGQPFGMDLAAINIQRGRDHGIPGYTAWREPCGLSPIRSWSDLESLMNFETIQRFRSLYDHVDDIDLYTGGLAERPIRGGIVGPTFGCIIAQQFSNLRKGDRFWYENGGFENSFTPAQLQQIRRVTFAQVLCQVLPDIESIQPFVFLSPDNFRNARLSCRTPEMDGLDLRPWEERRLAAQSQLPTKIQPSVPQAPQVLVPNASKLVVSGKLDEFGPNVELLGDHLAIARPVLTHDAQKLDGKLDFSSRPDNLDFSLNNSNQIPATKEQNTEKLQIKPSVNVNDDLDLINDRNKQQTNEKLPPLTTTTAKASGAADFDVIFLSGTRGKSTVKETNKREELAFDAVFGGAAVAYNRSRDGKIIKRSAIIDPRIIEYDDEDEYSEEYTDADSGRKQSTKKRKRKPTKVRATTPKPTTKRPNAFNHNRPLSSDFYNPLKIKVTNITTSTIDLGPDYDSKPHFPRPTQPNPTLLYHDIDRLKRPTIFFHTTRRPLTYDQDEYYVLHPTINKPNRQTATQHISNAHNPVVADQSKSPDYQVNINIHLVSSTPKTDVLINDKLAAGNPHVHVVSYDQIKPAPNAYYHQYPTTRRPLPIIPVRTSTTTARPSNYDRLRPTLTPTSQTYYYRPTTYNYDRFEDRPFSTSKRPYIYRPSESFLSMFEELHQQSAYYDTTKRPTYITSYVDKVTPPRRPNIPSYLYYNGGKYFTGKEPVSQSNPDAYYIKHTVQPSTTTDFNHGDKNFVKISSVLGNRYLPNAEKEQYIHTAQQKEGELELDFAIMDMNKTHGENETFANIEKFEETEEDDEGKIQIDVIPRESRQDDWVVYETTDDVRIIEEPQIEQSGERIASELPKPLSLFWHKNANSNNVIRTDHDNDKLQSDTKLI